MARRPGVTRGKLVDRAARIADSDGLEALTLARLAREFGVRPPSLFDHIDGRPGLIRALRVRSFEEQTELLRTAASGRSQEEAVRAIAGAYRQFAKVHPGLYRVTVPTFVGDSPEVSTAAQALLTAFLDTLRGYGIEGEEGIHAARFARATLHGFLLLELDLGFGLDPNVDESFARAVDGICEQLGHWPPGTPSSTPPSSRRPGRTNASGSGRRAL
jgi:AcrR family transcriptional regulator